VHLWVRLPYLTHKCTVTDNLKLFKICALSLRLQKVSTPVAFTHQQLFFFFISLRNVAKILFCQHSKTNVMHFLFSLLRIKGLYMFRALLAHPQEALYKRLFVYCVRVMSVGCTRIGVAVPLQSWCSQLYWYTTMHGQQNIKSYFAYRQFIKFVQIIDPTEYFLTKHCLHAVSCDGQLLNEHPTEK
jgi:hypothetical protein